MKNGNKSLQVWLIQSQPAAQIQAVLEKPDKKLSLDKKM